MQDRDLAALIRSGQRGNRTALTELVRRFERPVYAYLARMAPGAAEDACQDTFLRLVAALPRYRHRGRFRPWLFRLATSALVDALRAAGRPASPSRAAGTFSNGWGAAQAADPAPGPAEAAVRAEERDRLMAALAALPFEQRQVVALRTQADLTFREIAETLGCPLGTVLARMHRAVGALRRRLGGGSES